MTGQKLFDIGADPANAWIGTSSVTPMDRFAEMVAAHPTATAIYETDRGQDKSITYRELNDRALRIAGALTERFGEPVRIATLTDRTIEHISALLGIYLAGHTAVPLHPAYPDSRLAYIVDHCGAASLLTDDDQIGRARDSWGEMAQLIEDLEQSTPATDLPSIDLSAPALILYTSGSTGKPKGIIHSHRYMYDKTRTETAFYGFTATDRLSQLFPLSFAASLGHTYGALLNGATLLPYDPSVLGMHHLGEWIRDSGVTGMAMIPTLFRRTFGDVHDTGLFQNVRYLMLGAELVLKSDVELFKRLFPDDSVVVHRLASTETGAITRFVIRKDTDLRENVVPAGKPPFGQEIIITDDNGDPVAGGEIGELWVKGDNLVEGYWGDAELTASVFEQGPGNMRTYRTGDLARIDPDGNLIHLGRKDGRVKIRGYGVDLVEIERVLVGIEGVAEGAVKVFGSEGDNKLVAYYVSREGMEAGELREHFSQAVPDYMVPSTFVELPGLPLTPRGKIDRNALPEPGQEAHESSMVEPETDLEAQLLKLWKANLAIGQLGVEDDFFSMGGTSIQAYQLIGDIYRKMEVDLPASSLLDAPTVRQQADLIESGGGTMAHSVIAIREAGDRSPLFGVHGRGGGIIYLHKLAPLLDQETPIYGVQPEMHAGERPPYLTVEEMADHYLAEIRAIQPEGPYQIVGSCFGGLIAQEAARKLDEDGQRVDLLVVMDPPTHGIEKDHWMHHPWTLRWLKGYSKQVIRRTLSWPKRMARKYRDRKGVERTEYLSKLHIQARSEHIPKASAVPMTVIASKGAGDRQRQFWGDVARGGLEIEEFDGPHTEMWAPWNRKKIAEMLQEKLDTVEESRSAPAGSSQD